MLFPVALLLVVLVAANPGKKMKSEQLKKLRTVENVLQMNGSTDCDSSSCRTTAAPTAPAVAARQQQHRLHQQ